MRRCSGVPRMANRYYDTNSPFERQTNAPLRSPRILACTRPSPRATDVGDHPRSDLSRKIVQLMGRGQYSVSSRLLNQPLCIANERDFKFHNFVGVRSLTFCVCKQNLHLTLPRPQLKKTGADRQLQVSVPSPQVSIILAGSCNG